MRWLTNNQWWLTRVVLLPINILFFAVISFFLLRLIPGDPINAITDGGQISDEQRLRLEEELGISGSMFEQLTASLLGLVRLDLGNSLVSGRPVSAELLTRFPQTIELAVISLVATFAFSFALSYLTTFHPRFFIARSIRVYARAAGALPDFAIGVVLLFLFYVALRIAPAPIGVVAPSLPSPVRVTGAPLIDSILSGRADIMLSVLSHLTIPIACMVLAYTPLLLKQLLLGLDTAAAAPASLFRVATGGSRRALVVSVYRRGVPPALVVSGSLFGSLLGGVVVIESLFSLGGMGTYAVNAVNAVDLRALQGFLLVAAATTLTVYLLVDIANMLLDPRRRPGVRA